MIDYWRNPRKSLSKEELSAVASQSSVGNLPRAGGGKWAKSVDGSQVSGAGFLAAVRREFQDRACETKPIRAGAGVRTCCRGTGMAVESAACVRLDREALGRPGGGVTGAILCL